MVKRKPGQELGHRRRPGFVDVAGAPPSHVCTSNGCQRTRTLANDYLLSVGLDTGVPRKRLAFLANFIPRLLCQGGAWPPKGISEKDIRLLFLSATAACVDTGITGMRVQRNPLYQEVAAQILSGQEATDNTTEKA